MTKRFLNLFTALVMAVSLIGVLPAVTASASVGEPIEGYVCTYFENSEGTQYKDTYDKNGNIVSRLYDDDMLYTYTYTYYNNGKVKTKYENCDSNGSWEKYEYDINGNETYFEDNYGDWEKCTYDINGNCTYREYNMYGDLSWEKNEYDSNGNCTYYEDSYGNWTKNTYNSNGLCTYSEYTDGWSKYTYDTSWKIVIVIGKNTHTIQMGE